LCGGCAEYFSVKGEKTLLLLYCAQARDQSCRGRLQTEPSARSTSKRIFGTSRVKGYKGWKTDLTSKRSHISEVRKYRGLVRTANCQAELNLAKEIKIKTRGFSARGIGENNSARAKKLKIWHQNWTNALPQGAVLWDGVRWLKRLFIYASKHRLCSAFPSPHHGHMASPHVLCQLLNPSINYPSKAHGWFFCHFSKLNQLRKLLHKYPTWCQQWVGPWGGEQGEGQVRSLAACAVFGLLSTIFILILGMGESASESKWGWSYRNGNDHRRGGRETWGQIVSVPKFWKKKDVN